MVCSCSSLCSTTARHFGHKRARKELAAYQRAGPGTTTRRLLHGLLMVKAQPTTVLDIGSGIGTLTVELLKAGAATATCVDMSAASQAVGAEAARQQGLADRIRWVEADFVTIAASLPPADVVALDRVICCYPTYRSLLQEAAAHSRHFLALSYPRDRWFVRLALWGENAWHRLRGDPFRAFVHPIPPMLRMLEGAGFSRVHQESTSAWEAAIYARAAV